MEKPKGDHSVEEGREVHPPVLPSIPEDGQHSPTAEVNDEVASDGDVILANYWA